VIGWTIVGEDIFNETTKNYVILRNLAISKLARGKGLASLIINKTARHIYETYKEVD
jgi:hypothetical protein